MRLWIALLGGCVVCAAHPIDEIVERYWRERNLAPAAPVSDARFVRRVYLDLWGLLPTPQQSAAFFADGRADKRERLIDALLADRTRYAQHWISYWNDLLRNDEGVVYHGERKSITSWLYRALEDNLSYDRFVRRLLNPVEESDPDGFLIGVNWRGDVSASERPPLQAAQNSAQVFLGINLKCNSCHDSFVSKWKLKDAYGLAAFFAETDLEVVRCDVKTGERAAPRFLFPELGGVPAGASLAERRAAAAALFTTRENGRMPRTLANRFWKRLLGRGLIEPVDDMATRPWSAELLDALANEFTAQNYDLKALLRFILTSKAYQLPAVPETPRPYVFQGPEARRLTAEEFADAVSTITGEWRVKPSAGGGVYAREWQLKSTALTRALGRPIRDQVVTERQEAPTTLQSLELVNGTTLAMALHRGARRMLGVLPATPANLFDSGVIQAKPAAVDVDISGADTLWLLLEDGDSYDRSRVVAGWRDAWFEGGKARARLADLLPGAQRGKIHVRGEASAADAVTGPVPSEWVVDLRGRGFTRFRASVAVDRASLASDINPRVRFFIFREKPDRRQLVNVSNEPPEPSVCRTVHGDGDALITCLYRHALSRDPGEEERQIGRQMLGSGAQASSVSPDGLEDLLWALLLSPEFQYLQ